MTAPYYVVAYLVQADVRRSRVVLLTVPSWETPIIGVFETLEEANVVYKSMFDNEIPPLEPISVSAFLSKINELKKEDARLSQIDLRPILTRL
ncbi:MAG: hypothetical protein ACD_25C00183G0001 [uncultured bacterium]|uniref:Uncharacterized protein n=1 Tax=candidate division WWE3 bacterium TaxID=2053526 RepID=A0A656PNJ4_UNCKA|nr:hypothetical protein P147_WWE3C00001G0511 [candidate division WWE3 bacterium RAAC2_WWE3_1]EKD94883.1 MAG: hypothetical protein ACD_25C00183G0001 [uncultured bacterium]KKS28775.1 MAG: hypothetical protein UU91_C0014G0010 [candidate division WWE3 bacterium GW2011_GWB1_42_117]KKS55078.1 MAG: hypothetical protein UV21_C0003G0092 [candidate division WWE3 bacterium GW2011_GWD2_42_34]KKT04387.1 MAG: hypothetical protein UV83_C0013G0004 [candidate division WWE3 bacterium GW2011_GWE2_43_18]KKT07105.